MQSVLLVIYKPGFRVTGWTVSRASSDVEFLGFSTTPHPRPALTPHTEACLNFLPGVLESKPGYGGLWRVSIQRRRFTGSLGMGGRVSTPSTLPRALQVYMCGFTLSIALASKQRS